MPTNAIEVKTALAKAGLGAVVGVHDITSHGMPAIQVHLVDAGKRGAFNAAIGKVMKAKNLLLLDDEQDATLVEKRSVCTGRSLVGRLAAAGVTSYLRKGIVYVAIQDAAPDNKSSAEAICNSAGWKCSGRKTQVLGAECLPYRCRARDGSTADFSEHAAATSSRKFDVKVSDPRRPGRATSSVRASFEVATTRKAPVQMVGEIGQRALRNFLEGVIIETASDVGFTMMQAMMNADPSRQAAFNLARGLGLVDGGPGDLNLFEAPFAGIKFNGTGGRPAAEAVGSKPRPGTGRYNILPLLTRGIGSAGRKIGNEWLGTEDRKLSDAQLVDALRTMLDNMGPGGVNFATSGFTPNVLMQQMNEWIQAGQGYPFDIASALATDTKNPLEMRFGYLWKVFAKHLAIQKNKDVHTGELAFVTSPWGGATADVQRKGTGMLELSSRPATPWLKAMTFPVEVGLPVLTRAIAPNLSTVEQAAVAGQKVAWTLRLDVPESERSAIGWRPAIGSEVAVVMPGQKPVIGMISQVGVNEGRNTRNLVSFEKGSKAMLRDFWTYGRKERPSDAQRYGLPPLQRSSRSVIVLQAERTAVNPREYK